MRNSLYLSFLLMVLLLSCRKSQNTTGIMAKVKSPDSLNYVNQFIGKKPVAVNLWSTEPLQTKLKKTLGDQYDAFLAEVAHAQELKRDQVIYTIATLPDSATQSYRYTIMLLDTATTQIEVMFLKNSKEEQYQSNDESLYLPDEVRNLMYQYLKWNVYEGILPCADCQGIKTELVLASTDQKLHYLLQQTYLDSANGNKIVQQEGTYTIQHPNTDLPDANVYQIKKKQPDAILYFLQRSPNQLELLDSGHNRIKTDENLVLQKKELSSPPPNANVLTNDSLF